MTEMTTAQKLAEARRAVYQAIAAVNDDRGLGAVGRMIGGTDEDDRLLVGLLMDTATALAIATLARKKDLAADRRDGLAEPFIEAMWPKGER